MSDEEFVEDSYDDDEEDVLEYQWTKDHAFHDLMWYSSMLQSATAQFFELTAARLAADSNFKEVQKELHDAVTKEIESLPMFKEPEVTDG